MKSLLLVGVLLLTTACRQIEKTPPECQYCLYKGCPPHCPLG